MSLASGTRLGPYEIVAPLGAGGMGEVYRARDTRLDRTVAIKILPADFAEDARLKIRFAREAKMISALSHPHICTLHDVGREKDLDYLVMEYCEGKTLAKRIAEKALPIDEVLEYGIQIADALDKAHRQGIIHRDLKPSNIILTRSGVKLLDFGLARHHLASAAAESTVQQVTEEGTILGTVQYMAPELLQGREADARSDLFALGLVLYEMTTGKPPFTGTSRASLIAAILEHEPKPATELEPASPAALDRLIRACLEKDPDQRIQSAHDVALQLRWMREKFEEVAGKRESSVSMWTALALAAAIVLLLGAVTLLALRPPAAPPREVTRLSIALPSGALLPPEIPAINALAVSPDGRRVVYLAEQGLVLRDLDTSEIRLLPGTEWGHSPFFSPDGEWLAFMSREIMKKVRLEGAGAPLAICDAKGIRGGTWGADGTIVFGRVFSPLQRVSADGGAPQALTSSSAEKRQERWPSFLPDGEHVLYVIGDHSGSYEGAKIAVVSAVTGASKIVLEGGSSPRFLPSGHLVYLRSGTLFAVRFDPKALRTSGEPVPLLDDVQQYLPGGLAHYDVAADGSVFYIPRDPAQREDELVWVTRDGDTTPITSLRTDFGTARVSPNGESILVERWDGSEVNIWLYEAERDAWTRMTRGGLNWAPVWSPDASRVVFTSNRSGTPNLFLVPVDGSAPARQLTDTLSWPQASSWSADGQSILATTQFQSSGSDIWILSLDSLKFEPFVATPYQETQGVFSPDGGWVSYTSNEGGEFEIYVRAFPGPGAKRVVSSGGGISAQWSRDGSELFYWKGYKDGEMRAVPVQTFPRFTSERPRPLFRGHFQTDFFHGYFDTSRDGRFAMIRPRPIDNAHISVVYGLDERLRRQR